MCAINKSQSKTDFYMQLAMLRRFSLPVMWAMRHWRIKKNTTTTTSMVAKVERTAGRQLKNCRQILARSLREFEPGFHRHTCRAYPESHSNWLTTIVFHFLYCFRSFSICVSIFLRHCCRRLLSFWPGPLLTCWPASLSSAFGNSFWKSRTLTLSFPNLPYSILHRKITSFVLVKFLFEKHLPKRIYILYILYL